MKVLHILRSNRFSGAENVVCQVIGRFNSRYGYEMAYCSPKGPIADILKDKGIPFIGLDSLSPLNVKKAIDEYKPDIIHAHGTSAGFIASSVSCKIPLVLHIHNNSKNSSRLSLKSIANILPFYKAKHVIWVSDDCLNCYMFSGFVKKKSTVISNGIDTEIYSRATKIDKNKLIMVSRFAPAKDHLTVVRSLPLVDERLHVYFVGDGETMEECKRLVDDLKLENRVHFLGKRFDIPHLINDAYIGIQSSHWEGFGLSALEIMACGVPLIASAANGLKQVVEGAGLIFEIGNEKELANTINALDSNTEYYNSVAEKCRERAEMYSMSKMAAKCKSVYDRIIM